MEVHHKPKPWHGWREFLKEYAIVVVGVLTALAAEQVAEKLHERTVAADARAAIRGELALNLAYLRSRAATQGCLDKRLSEIQTILDHVHPDGSYERPSWVGRPQFWSLETVRWDAAAQAGRAALIPAAEVALYSKIYTQLRIVIAEMATEQSDWARLRSLQSQSRLPSQAVYDLNLLLGDARYRAWRIALVTRQELADARMTRLEDMANPNPVPQSICLPMTTSAAEGRASFALGEIVN